MWCSMGFLPIHDTVIWTAETSVIVTTGRIPFYNNCCKMESIVTPWTALVADSMRFSVPILQKSEVGVRGPSYPATTAEGRCWGKGLERRRTPWWWSCTGKQNWNLPEGMTRVLNLNTSMAKHPPYSLLASRSTHSFLQHVKDWFEKS